MKVTTVYAWLFLLLMAPAAWAAGEESDDAAAIRERIESYVAAFNQHDAQAVANHWAENAVYIRRDSGERIEGRPGIATYFAKAFEADDTERLSVTVDAIRLIPPNVAIEDGTAELVSGGESFKSTYTAVHVKQDGKWYLDSVRETDTPAPPVVQPPEQLEQLGWLVGQWVDADENATVRTRWSWSKKNRFLTAAFSVATANGVEMEGMQIIGWDPAAGHIRSWIFDSEGGFGEGVWRHAGNEWTVEMSQTLSDGAQASAINVYKLVDENTFTWKSVERKLNDRPQPDIDEVTVRRE